MLAILVPGVSDPNQTNKRAFLGLLVLVEIVKLSLESVIGSDDFALGAIYHKYDVGATEDFSHEVVSLLSFLSSLSPWQSLAIAFLLDRRIDQDQSEFVS